MKKMSNKTIIRKIKEWQKCPYLHQLTCSKDSRHPPLRAKELDGKVILACPKCNYIQKRIPSTVIGVDIDKIQKEIEKFLPGSKKGK